MDGPGGGAYYLVWFAWADERTEGEGGQLECVGSFAAERMEWGLKAGLVEELV